jgi:hypothetical protein
MSPVPCIIHCGKLCDRECKHPAPPEPAPERSKTLPAWLYDYMGRQGYWDMAQWERKDG